MDVGKSGGSETPDTDGSHQPQRSSRPKRNHTSKPGNASASPGDEDQEPPETKRRRARKTKTPSAVAAAPLPSKEYLEEGSEHTYRTNTCPKCRRCFKMRSHLQEHLHLHFPDPTLQCPTCKRYFTSKSKLRIHRLREAGEKRHRCHLCEYSAVERNAIRRHLASVHADEAGDGVRAHSYPCPTCGQSFGQSRSLKAHMKTHATPSGSRACFHPGCSFQSSQRKEMVRHAADAHAVTAVECRHHTCGAVFRNEADMEAHYRTHQAYHCSQCVFSCSNKSLFLQHQRHGHPGEDQLCCDFCPFVTFYPVELEKHMGHLHANEKIHRCPQCSYVTSHKRGLKRHMLMHSGEKPHKCSQCDFRCRDESYLSKHMLTHSDHKNFMCAECGYVTKWKHYLNVHMRKHAGDLRYQCDQCPYRCHRMDQLNSHKLRHQAKSLMCEICAYACKRKYELRNHMLAKHSGEETPSSVHKCKYCSYATCYRQALQNHENCKHTKLREFRCALCRYSSFSSVSLFLHKRKVHGYVPGDKAWLENYASKEKERNSAQFSQDFYNKPSQPSTSEGACSADPSPQAVEVSPEEYCTLVLTTLSTADYHASSLQNQEGISATQAPSSPHLEDAVSEVPREEAEASSPSEEDDDAEREHSDLEEDRGPQPQVESDGGTSGSHNQLLESELRLEAMKKLDRDQAESMVLEGRVQMLVIPTADVYRCDRCSYVTGKESTLKNHRQAACHARTKGHQCQACGAQFKQKRGLDSHVAKKCPARPRKTRAFVGVSNTTAEREGQQVDENSDRLPASENTNSTETKNQESQQQGAETEDLTNCESGEKQNNDVQTKKPESSSRNKQRNVPLKSLYAEIDGKYKCKMCSFSSVRLATVERHTSTCRKSFKKKDQIIPGVEDESERTAAPVRSAAKRLQCEECTFTCKQARCMTQHVALKHRGEQPHRCGFCPFSTSRRYRLEEHQSLHTGLGRHGCDMCDKTFGALTKLRQHKMRIHDKRPTRFCSLCDFSSYTLDDVRRHSLRCHAGELHHACTHCDARFSSEVALRNHCRRVHQLPVCFSCKQCDFTCGSEATLKTHQESRHPQVKCNTCQEAFATRESLELHQRTHLAHACQLCPFAAKTRQLFAQHLLSQHEDGPPEDKPFKCSTCPFVCRHQLVLEQHLRSHGGKRLYKCTDCEYSTRNRQKITWHIRIHTGEKPYGCERCSYTCTDPSRLKLHMRVHQEEKKYLCPECGYKCKWATQLKYHMTKHTGEKPYACDACEYRTNRADALRAHRDTQHCQLRPYVCEKCGKSFKTSFILKTHQRQHSDERPYACGSCSKSFRWPAGLRHHFLSHTKQQPFSCSRCPYRAKQKFQVVKHLRKHHPEVSVETGVVRDSEAGGLTLKEALQGTVEEEEQEEEQEETAP